MVDMWALLMRVDRSPEARAPSSAFTAGVALMNPLQQGACRLRRTGVEPRGTDANRQTTLEIEPSPRDRQRADGRPLAAPLGCAPTAGAKPRLSTRSIQSKSIPAARLKGQKTGMSEGEKILLKTFPPS